MFMNLFALFEEIKYEAWQILKLQCIEVMHMIQIIVMMERINKGQGWL